MSKPVDVLLVMAKCANQAELGAAKYGGSVLSDHAESTKAARAAVAELIEADEEYDAAEAEYVAHDKSLFKRDKAWYEEWERMELRCDAAIARRAAALARVRGAA